MPIPFGFVFHPSLHQLIQYVLWLLQPPAFNLTDADQTCRNAIINSQVYAACGGVSGLVLDIDAKVEACVTDLQVMLRLPTLWTNVLSTILWQCLCSDESWTLPVVTCISQVRTNLLCAILCRCSVLSCRHCLQFTYLCQLITNLHSSILCRCQVMSCGLWQQWTVCNLPVSTSC